MSVTGLPLAGRELEGRVALVTGGARNIGRAISIDLAAAVAAIAVNTRASREDADALAKSIREAGGAAEAYLADIAESSGGESNDRSRRKAFRPHRHSRAQCFSTPRGAVQGHEFRRVAQHDVDHTRWFVPLYQGVSAVDDCEWRRAASSRWPAMRCCWAIPARRITRRRRRSVGLTRVLAKELADDNIRVNCVSPGSMDTVLSRPPFGARAGERQDPARTLW